MSIKKVDNKMELSEVLSINKDNLLVVKIPMGEYQVIGAHAAGFVSKQIKK